MGRQKRDLPLGWIHLDTLSFSECLSGIHLHLRSLRQIPAGFLWITTSILHQAPSGQAAGSAIRLLASLPSEQAPRQGKAMPPSPAPTVVTAKQADKTLSQLQADNLIENPLRSGSLASAMPQLFRSHKALLQRTDRAQSEC